MNKRDYFGGFCSFVLLNLLHNTCFNEKVEDFCYIQLNNLGIINEAGGKAQETQILILFFFFFLCAKDLYLLELE